VRLNEHLEHDSGQTVSEHDDQELLNRFNDEKNNHMLFIGWHDYWNAIGKVPIEAQVFQVWYLALYLDKLNPDENPRPFMESFLTSTANLPLYRRKSCAVRLLHP
jgi:hypothetical protein